MVLDPVCKMLVDESESDIKEGYEGRTYFFCSDECRERFQTDPEEYAEKKEPAA
jgi:Cu+-exporting ATPase